MIDFNKKGWIFEHPLFKKEEMNKESKLKPSPEEEIEKIKKSILWNDEYIKLPMETVPEYPDNFIVYFGMCSNTTISLKKETNEEKFLTMCEYLKTNSFLLSKQGENDQFEFVNLDRKILIFTDEDYSYDEDLDLEKIDIKLSIRFSPHRDNKEFVEEFIEKYIHEFSFVTHEDSKFYMIASGRSGLYTREAHFDPVEIVNDDFSLYYGDKFPRKKIEGFFDSKKGNLMILHGPPGCGKSSLLKYLSSITDKKVIFIPPTMLSVLSQPDFCDFMMKQQNSILILEDAEMILSSERNAATNTLLNITDGLLADSYKVKIICTLNSDLKEIDEALMRKGRLYLEYKVNKLSKDDAQRLVDHLELNVAVKDEMSLAEIFNDEENTQEDSFKERSIGFFAN